MDDPGDNSVFPMRPFPEVQAALDRCFDVFSLYPLPKSWDFSPYKDGDTMLRELSSAPLRELAGEQIGPYAGSAVLTVGGVDDYKHFLPRILEQAVFDPAWMGTDPDIISRRLVMMNWRHWPDEECQTIYSLYERCFSQAILEHPEHSHFSAKKWFWGLVTLGGDAAEALRNWISVPSAHAALQLARFVSEARWYIENSSADDLSLEALDEVRRWLLSGAPQAFLVEAAATIAEADRWQIEGAFDEVENLTAERLRRRTEA